MLGGKPVRREPFPGWPRFDQRDEKNLLDVLHSGKWFRGGGECVNRFEAAYAELTGAKHCVATANGTSALFASLAALGIEPGDEVIVPPYTFIATINSVLLQYALPVFVDTDPESFQIDAGARSRRPSPSGPRPSCPCTWAATWPTWTPSWPSPAKHKMPVIEDACQAHLAEWRGKKVGTLGTAGCFSFQVTKNLSSGEGGAILTADDELAERCYAFQNNNRAQDRHRLQLHLQGSRGANLRMTEFQGNLLLAQMTRLEEQSRTREQNARYLTQHAQGDSRHLCRRKCTRAARETPITFTCSATRARRSAACPAAKFLAALDAEGIPCSSGYRP